MPAVTMNSLDIIKGAMCAITIAPWVTAAGSSTGVDVGAVKDIELNLERKMESVRADNVTWEIDRFNTETTGTFKFTLIEADLIKMAMVAVQKELDAHKPGIKMIMQVHDELVFELPEGELDWLRGHIPRLMAGVADLKVPLLAVVGVGPNWDKAH